MCGRFNLRVTADELQEFFDLFRKPEVPPRYNIAPTQTTLVCRLDDTGERELAPLRWGLIPSWSKDIKIGASLINARGETVSEKPSFRTGFKKRRCLVPVSGSISLATARTAKAAGDAAVYGYSDLQSFQLAKSNYQLQTVIRKLLWENGYNEAAQNLRGFGRGPITKLAKGGLVVTSIIEAGISISCGIRCS